MKAAQLEADKSELAEMCDELQDARERSALWKRAAKNERFRRRAWEAMAFELGAESFAAKDAEIERLRASLKWALVHVRYPRPVVPALAPTDAGEKFERGLAEARAALLAVMGDES